MIPLLNDLFLSPAAAYTLMTARAVTWQYYTRLIPLLEWMCVDLFPTFLGVDVLPPLNMVNHITIRRQRPLKEMLLYGDNHQDSQLTIIVQAPPRQPPP